MQLHSHVYHAFRYLHPGTCLHFATFGTCLVVPLGVLTPPHRVLTLCGPCALLAVRSTVSATLALAGVARRRRTRLWPACCSSRWALEACCMAPAHWQRPALACTRPLQAAAALPFAPSKGAPKAGKAQGQHQAKAVLTLAGRPLDLGSAREGAARAFTRAAELAVLAGVCVAPCNN